ncbi:SMI1/KNR4 family protein [Oceanirhabdus sp. W0125-5]|uniref:SMI1/KNR4 family protein n=1 Tax=Oceanirhabdus sp. W0125-5 TaxID=2999116 RepID=UPI0022F33942|nr:SMI1/KNR4 family protein [Oceanirhabdus sp. W0125-5]WBW96075.1 SMI1/KNR4 family protein [Oceanirhabdus sp. W0125-5]
MRNKLEFLRKYDKKIQLVNNDEINDKMIPSEWYKIFIEEDSQNRIRKVLSIWEKYFAVELSNTIAYLTENLVEVDLVKSMGKYSILYSIKTLNGGISFYQGGNPEEQFNNPKLEKVWSDFPNSIRRFYEKIHNGFYYYASESMGLVPIESVTFFDDYEWGIIEDLGEPIQIDLKTTFGFFLSGAGGYVAIDYNNNIATVWFSNDKPEYNVDFWSVVDEWIVFGLED